jgi:hypothetical protein
MEGDFEAKVKAAFDAMLHGVLAGTESQLRN